MSAAQSCHRHRNHNPFCADCKAETERYAREGPKSPRHLALEALAQREAHEAEQEAKRREELAGQSQRQHDEINAMARKSLLGRWFPDAEWAILDLGVSGVDAVIAPLPDMDFPLGIRQTKPVVREVEGRKEILWPKAGGGVRAHPRPICDCNNGDGTYHAHYGAEADKYESVERQIQERPWSCARCPCEELTLTEVLIGSVEIDTETQYPYWSGGPAQSLADIGRHIKRHDERAAR